MSNIRLFRACLHAKIASATTVFLMSPDPRASCIEPGSGSLLSFCRRIAYAENRFPLFGAML
jgi:hypothetical protein